MSASLHDERYEEPRPEDATHERFLRDVMSGLAQAQKRLPSKYFYDEHGSQLFDRICELEEYYPTRADLEGTRAHVGALSQMIGNGVRLIELGSGSSMKTRILLDTLDVREYVPVDISKEHMEHSAQKLAQDYPALSVSPCEGDYTRELALPEEHTPHEVLLVYFPGSSVGNFHPDDARRFLGRVRALLEEDRAAQQGHRPGALFIGVDLKKDRQTLELAYDDPSGVTASFNLNMLARINRELGADFDLEQFTHRARYDEELGRIEMYLVSQTAQRVHLGGEVFDFAKGEAILTEVSYKYSREDFQRLAKQAGLEPSAFWTDPRGLFGLHVLGLA